MRFWDSSAIVPLCVNQPSSEVMRALLQNDPRMAVWWGAPIECWSAFARLRRDGIVDLRGEDAARFVLRTLQESWVEVHPGEDVRQQAGRLVRVHAIRAPDAFQLAAALVWKGSATSWEIVALDRRLRDAAILEGLVPLPT